jgi:hypothetical protein
MEMTLQTAQKIQIQTLKLQEAGSLTAVVL